MEIAKTLLQEVGVVVTEAGNGQEAVDMFESSPVNYYHAILMDILMPVKDGYTAAKEIKNLNRPDSVDVPIIAMTANAYNEDKEKVYESGMCEHIIKPIQIEKLYDALLKFRK
jgi:CheY-like chemotaxis protein